MKKIALSLSVLLPLIFVACKKDKDNGMDTPAPQPQMRFTFVNISDTSDYTVVENRLPDVPLLQPGTAKTYTLNIGAGFYSPLFCRQGKVDTTYFSLSLKPAIDHIFIMRDGDHARASYFATGCFEPPSGKSIIRYLNASSYSKMEIADSANTKVLLTYNSGQLNQWADTAVQSQSLVCNSFVGGSYTLRVYTDTMPNVPVAVKTNVQIKENKVFYAYLDANNEIKLIER